MIGVRRPAAAAVPVAVLMCALVAGLWALGSAVQQAPTYQGDQLGMGAGESPAQYEARARASLDDASGASWALVTFEADVSPTAAAAVLAPLPRVSAAVFPGASARAIPEPVAGEDRTDVFTREAQRLQASTGMSAPSLSGAVVRAEPEALRDLVRHREVYAVEVLPADARWGAFGISPVTRR